MTPQAGITDAAAAVVETLAEHACFGGVQGFYRHRSAAADRCR